MKRKNYKKNKKINLSLNRKTIFFTIVIIFLALHVFIALENLSYGTKLSAQEEKKSEVLKQNRYYQQELVDLTSLSKLDSRKEELGFTKPQEVIYISEEDFVAKAGFLQ